MTRTNDPAYLRNRRKLKAQGNLVCVICGGPIDTSLPSTDPMAFHADHVTPVAAGGRNDGPLQASHARCNRRRGSRPLDAVRSDPHTRSHY